MKRIHWVLMLAVAASAAVLLAANVDLPGPSRVAVCNVRKVMVDYQRFIALKQRVDAQEKKAGDEMKKRSDDLDRMLKQLADLKKGSPDYERLDNDCWQFTFQARAFQEVEKNRLERERRDGLVACYSDVVAEIAAYARESGIDIVHYARDLPLESAVTVADVEQLISNNPVLYASPQADITAAVTARLNAKFQAAGSATPPQPPAPAPAPAPMTPQK